MGTFVVGIDGSEESVAALRWAVEHSRPDDVIVAVGAWETMASLGTRDTDDEAELLEKLTIETVDETAHRITGELGRSGGTVERRHERGDPRAVLRRLAYEADLGTNTCEWAPANSRNDLRDGHAMARHRALGIVRCVQFLKKCRAAHLPVGHGSASR